MISAFGIVFFFMVTVKLSLLVVNVGVMVELLVGCAALILFNAAFIFAGGSAASLSVGPPDTVLCDYIHIRHAMRVW